MADHTCNSFRIARRAMLTAALATLLAAVGCRSTEFISAPGGRVVIVEGFAPDEPLLIDSPAGLPSGWVIADPEATPLVGDGVTLLIVIQRGGKRDVYYLDIELLNEPGDQYPLVASADDQTRVSVSSWEFLATRNRLLDEQGRLIVESRGSVAWSLLRTGPYDSFEGYALNAERGSSEPDAAQRSADGRKASMLTDEEMQRTLRGFLSFIAFSYGVQDDTVIRRLIQPLFTFRQGLVLLGSGFKTTVRIDEDSVRRMGTTTLANGLGVDSNRGAVELSFGSTPVFRAEALCIPPVAPFGLAGGLVRLDAHNLGQHGTRVIVQPIATRRGATWPTLSRLMVNRTNNDQYRFTREYLAEDGTWFEGELNDQDREFFGLNADDALPIESIPAEPL